VKWGFVVGKPQFAAAVETSTELDETVHSFTSPDLASVGKTPINEEPTKNPESSPTLDHESLTAVLRFFELLDEWDHKEGRP
jgi:hypothetical protein